MNISIISSEAVPFAKTGGLADVIGALPSALASLDHKVSVFLPYYSKIMDIHKYDTEIVKTDLWIQVGEHWEGYCVRKYTNDVGVDFYFIENDYYFWRSDLYGPSNESYYDNGERFLFFSQAVLLAMKAIGIRSDVIHTNDWQSALVPLYLKIHYNDDKFFKDIKVVFTIHNIEYQGVFNKDIMLISNIPWDEFIYSKFEYFDKVNYLKAGLVYSDVVTTVSKQYAKEIKNSSWLTKGLDSVLKLVDLRGIVNGIDFDVWNPETDSVIVKKYNAENLVNKKACKKDLIKICGLKDNEQGPVIAMVSRLVKHKGLDIVREIMEDILDLDKDIRFIVLGKGAPEYEQYFDYLKIKYPENVSITTEFNNELANKIYAGSDMFLMPSESEPCGLGQLIAFRYGTVPVVNPVGGLYDTVIDYNEKAKTGSGFVLDEYSDKGLKKAIKRALKLYKKKDDWENLIVNDMKLDSSWKKSAEEYVKLYESL